MMHAYLVFTVHISCLPSELAELGNGNNRNLKDRLVPELMKLCDKYKLPNTGTYVDLRVRLKEKSPFESALSFGLFDTGFFL